MQTKQKESHMVVDGLELGNSLGNESLRVQALISMLAVQQMRIINCSFVSYCIVVIDNRTPYCQYAAYNPSYSLSSTAASRDLYCKSPSWLVVALVSLQLQHVIENLLISQPARQTDSPWLMTCGCIYCFGAVLEIRDRGPNSPPSRGVITLI